MLDVATAQAIVLEHLVRPPATVVPTTHALGLVLVTNITADRDAPPFTKSLRDGYALRADDTGDRTVIGEVAAGMVPAVAIGPGESVRIFTGAMLPDGADAVVMQEECDRDGPTVRFETVVRTGTYVLARGAEMKAGDVVLASGTQVTPAVVGMLATLGVTEVSVFPRPRVAILATGDELVDANQEPGPGQIRNSNGPMLTALVSHIGGIAKDHGIGRDDRTLLTAKIRDALESADVVAIAGGVSVGDFDLVPQVLAELGATIHFHTVRMKPGKPLLFGTLGNKLVFGLPGNPASAFVGFHLFVGPALRKLLGHDIPGPHTIASTLTEEFAANNDRPTYHPARIADGRVTPHRWLGAADLRGLIGANALLVLPAGTVRYNTGALIDVIELR